MAASTAAVRFRVKPGMTKEKGKKGDRTPAKAAIQIVYSTPTFAGVTNKRGWGDK